MVVRVLKLLAIILLCIACVSYIVKGESYNEKFSLTFFLGQLENENIPNLYEPVKEWFAEAKTGNDFIDTIASLTQALIYGTILPIQTIIFLGYFFKIWFV